MFFRVATLLALSSFPCAVFAQGLKGLGPPGGLTQVPPEVARIETTLLSRINEKYRKDTAPLRTDARLRGFARAQAERAARGQAKANEIPKLIESRRLAPFGYYFQFVYGADEKELVDAIHRDRELRTSLSGEFARIGIGGFLAPAENPFFQVMLLLAKDQDPRAGQPGLSQAETDPVMNRAAETMKANCYDLELSRNPNLRGQALFEIRIGPAGHVDEAKLLKGFDDGERFDICLLAVVKSLRFPEPYKGLPVTLRHPVRFAPPQGDRIVGKLSDGQVRSTFARVAPELRNCYNRRVEALFGKKLKGRITLSVDVAKTGDVTKVGIVDDSIADARLNQCVTAVVTQLRFPEPSYGGPTTVRFPIDFGK